MISSRIFWSRLRHKPEVRPGHLQESSDLTTVFQQLGLTRSVCSRITCDDGLKQNISFPCRVTRLWCHYKALKRPCDGHRQHFGQDFSQRPVLNYVPRWQRACAKQIGKLLSGICFRCRSNWRHGLPATCTGSTASHLKWEQCTWNTVQCSRVKEQFALSSW